VTITLNQSKFCNYSLTDVEAGKTDVDLLTGWAVEAGKGLAKDILDYAFGLVVAGTYGDTGADKVTAAAAAFTTDDLIDGLKLANDKKWNTGSIILNYAYAAALMKDGAIKDASAAGDNSVIRSGRIGNLFGFPVYAYPLPSAAGNAGLIINPAALALAVRAAGDAVLAPTDFRAGKKSGISKSGRGRQAAL
jgi:hypothetical protein